jgi:hypothetical protein
LLGWWVYLIPIAPLLVALVPRERECRPAAFVLAAWSVCFVPLAYTQMRFANDLAAPAAICCAVVLAAFLRGVGLRGQMAVISATAIGVAAAVPSIRTTFSRGPVTLAWFMGPAPLRDPLLESPGGALIRFAQQVRAATPETSSYLTPGAKPQYGIATHPSFGHTLRHYSRRPVPVDNFWDKFAAFDQLAGLGELSDEGDVAALLAELRLRYLATTSIPGDTETVIGRLSGTDGAAVGERAPLAGFRLVTEGPGKNPDRRGAAPRSRAAEPRHALYKLFEAVDGAELEVHAAPASHVEARFEFTTPANRRVVYIAAATAGYDGVARLRVPYADQTRSYLINPLRR